MLAFCNGSMGEAISIRVTISVEDALLSVAARWQELGGYEGRRCCSPSLSFTNAFRPFTQTGFKLLFHGVTG
jgi:hypothetical protein